MKKIAFTTILVAVLLVGSFNVAYAAKPVQTDANGNETAWEKSGCATIQDGTITDAKGNPLQLGFDQYGYNYQAHIFVGYYDNYSRPPVPVTSGDWLVMKWSDSWLANVDCNGDNKLDRGLVNGVVSGISMGWETNHLIGSYEMDGSMQSYTDFVKIVWTGPGSSLWGQYTIIEEVLNDPAGGDTGLNSKLPGPGFGLNDQWTTLP
jgi:hypothetical protein